jgi:hypothetical protein
VQTTYKVSDSVKSGQLHDEVIDYFAACMSQWMNSASPRLVQFEHTAGTHAEQTPLLQASTLPVGLGGKTTKQELKILPWQTFISSRGPANPGGTD